MFGGTQDHGALFVVFSIQIVVDLFEGYYVCAVGVAIQRVIISRDCRRTLNSTASSEPSPEPKWNV